MTKDYIQIEGKFYQECEVIMLPVEKYITGFHNLWKKGNKLFYKEGEGFPYGTSRGMYLTGYKPQYLYFLSNEEIKDGDWYMYWLISEEKEYKIAQCRGGILPKCPKAKIIATTDKELRITKEYRPEAFQHIKYPRPSNEFLRVYCEKDGIDKVLVEVEKVTGYCDDNYPMTSTGDIWVPNKLKIAPDNTITIKPIEKKNHWDDAFRIIWNKDISEETREAVIREKYNITSKSK